MIFLRPAKTLAPPIRPGRGRIICNQDPLVQRPWLVPVGITPDLGTALAACRATETVLDIRQPNVILPSIAAHPDIVAAPIMLTKDQKPTHAFGAGVQRR